jgi:hypothetical protein
LKFIHEINQNGVFYQLYNHNDFFRIIDMITSIVPFMKKLSHNEFSNRMSEAVFFEVDYYAKALGQSRYSTELLAEIDVFQHLTELNMHVASISEAISGGLDDELRNSLLRNRAPTLRRLLANIKVFFDNRRSELGQLPTDLVVILSDPKEKDVYSVWKFMGDENAQGLLIAKLVEQYKDLKEFCDNLKLDDLPPSPPSTPSSERSESPIPIEPDNEPELTVPFNTPLSTRSASPIPSPSRSLTRSAPP